MSRMPCVARTRPAAALREGGDAAQEEAAKQVHGGLGPAVLGEIAGRHGGDAGIEGFAGVALSAVMRQQGCAGARARARLKKSQATLGVHAWQPTPSRT